MCATLEVLKQVPEGGMGTTLAFPVEEELRSEPCMKRDVPMLLRTLVQFAKSLTVLIRRAATVNRSGWSSDLA